MAPDSNDKRSNRIPIRFMDAENDRDPTEDSSEEISVEEPEGESYSSEDAIDLADTTAGEVDDTPVEFEGGPITAELVATRAELKRVQEENKELKDRLARRQADFENYRKRVDRERSETYNRVVADVASKLLGVLDNLKRALETEASLEASESDEFRHFLSGVDLIYKQLSGVLEAMGVKPIVAVGERFDPHIHEAVVTEVTDEVEPDTITQEIRAGYRLGDKLIRPALVKVATRN
jgi:molecular chaperone GrpE